MIRWNGWGDETTHMEAPEPGRRLIAEIVGEGRVKEDAPLDRVLEAVPESRLPDHSLVSKDEKLRVDHSHGQSLPDWVAMREGAMSVFPDAVAVPATLGELEAVLEYADNNKAIVIPYGGGTSVVGHLDPPVDRGPVLCVSMARLNRLVSFDPYSRMATFEAGVRGPDLESQLQARGHTLGHYPQSFELSTLGGWVVTRSSGQQSLYYGRIDQSFLGGELLTPAGTWNFPNIPASSAGPDFRHVLLGSEGRMGILTRATVKVVPVPEKDDVYGAFFPSWDAGVEGVRELVGADLPLSMIRLSNPNETVTNMALSGHSTQVAMLKTYLKVRGVDIDGATMALVGLIGNPKVAGAGKSEMNRIVKRHGGVVVGKNMGETWKKKRFLLPYLRNTLWDLGYCVDTLETCVTWDRVKPTMEDVENTIRETMAKRGEGIHVFTHLSHVYKVGSSIYTTFVFLPGKTPEETLEKWRALKEAASQTIVMRGGTISHQHGVGRDHAPYLEAEKGPMAMSAMEDLFNKVDPEKRMNPGKLILD
ncbi:MAG: FAD-binding oxidoreductase [Desulfatibacillaceae bacterium]